MVKQLASYEDKAIELIKKNGGVIIQSDLWKKLKLDSREGSRLVMRLVKKGLVKREEITVNGRKTYKLYLTKSNNEGNFSLKVSLASILDIPCATCPVIDQCGLGYFYEPSSCVLMDSWVSKIAGLRSRS